MASCHLFPRYHVRPPRGHLNDPNGPILVDGIYHLYFQYRHTTDHESPVMWGHVTSRDLAHWSYHRAAITPHPLLIDRDGCYSGNTVVDPEGRIRAFYSGRRSDHRFESVLCAISDDSGASFGEPVQVLRDPGPDEAIITFRDPFVWLDGERWLMVVGAGDSAGVASARLYSSPDLETWTHVGPLARLPRTIHAELDVDTGEMWECPQVLHHDGTAVLLVGAWTQRDGTMRVYALTGVAAQGTDEKFDVTAVDAGPDFYAASVLRDSPHGAIMWGWAREARDYSWCVEDGWSGALTLPRLVTPHVDGRLLQVPSPGIDGLRATKTPRLVDDLGADDLSAQLEIEATASRGAPLQLRLRFGPEEHLDIVLDADLSSVRIDRDRASLDPRAVGGVVSITEAFTDQATIRVYLDGSLLEVFTSAGHAATLRCYPTTPPPWSLEVSPGHTVRVWPMSDAADTPESPPLVSS